jgi:hypothetical protein
MSSPLLKWLEGHWLTLSEKTGPSPTVLELIGPLVGRRLTLSEKTGPSPTVLELIGPLVGRRVGELIVADVGALVGDDVG